MSTHPSELEDFRTVIEQAGYAWRDFECSPRDTTVTRPGIFPIVGQVTVTYTKSAVEYTYDTGFGTSWVVQFERDLKAGRFATPNVA